MMVAKIYGLDQALGPGNHFVVAIKQKKKRMLFQELK